MAHISEDRICETSTTTGTGALTLAGAFSAKFRAFSAVMTSPSDTCYYLIEHQSANEWETGTGTYSASNTLTRTTVSRSTNANAAVNFSAGTKTVSIVFIGEKTAAWIADGRAVISGVTQYTIPGVSLSTVSTRVMVANRIWYEPMVVRTTTTFDQMILEVQTASSASTVIRMAIYACDTAHQPGARQVDAGTVAADSTGVKTASISLTLTPGLYLKACISDSTATLRTFRSGGPPSDFDTGLGTSPLISNIFVAGSGTTLPDPGTAWTGNNKTATGFEHTMLLRVSVP